MCRRLLCYGDSNTYGYDPRSYLGGRYPDSVRWTGLLRGYGWDVINRGENGRSIPRSDSEIKAAVQSLCCVESDILTIMLGSNDLLQMPSPSARECADRMERFLTALLHADGWDKSRNILLIAPLPMMLDNCARAAFNSDLAQLIGAYDWESFTVAFKGHSFELHILHILQKSSCIFINILII